MPDAIIAGGVRIETDYDPLRRLTLRSAGAQPDGEATSAETYDYDALGRPIAADTPTIDLQHTYLDQLGLHRQTD